MTQRILTTALFYNKWTGWENREICNFFRKATVEDLAQMKAGDRIWMDVDPIHPNGKVYGYLASEFKKLENDQVYHSCGSFHVDYLKNVRILQDEAGLREFIDQNPLATDIIGNSGRMASAIVGAMGIDRNPDLN